MRQDSKKNAPRGRELMNVGGTLLILLNNLKDLSFLIIV